MFNESWELERRIEGLHKDIKAIEITIVNVESIPECHFEDYKTDALKSLKSYKTKLEGKLADFETELSWR